MICTSIYTHHCSATHRAKWKCAVTPATPRGASQLALAQPIQLCTTTALLHNPSEHADAIGTGSEVRIEARLLPLLHPFHHLLQNLPRF